MNDIQSYIERLFTKENHFYDNHYLKVNNQEVTHFYNSLKNWLLSHCEKSDIVALYLEHNYLYALVEVACMETGVVFIPMKNDWPQERVDQIKTIADIKYIIDHELLEKIKNQESHSLSAQKRTLKGDDPLYIMFTSGSTGVPKGVEILREGYENFLSWVDQTFSEVNEDDRLINSTQYTFDVSLMELALLLTKNVHFYSSNIGNNALILAKEINDLKITISVTVPNNFNILLSDRLREELDYSSLKSIMLAGSRFPTSLWDKLNESLPNINVYNCYGPTEATIYCLYKKMTKNRDLDINSDTVSIGKALTNLEAIVVDENNSILHSNTHGELLIGGNQVMNRYINSKELTEKVLVSINGKTYYRTGDLSFYNDNGEYFVVGRNDDTIKVSGQRVNLSDIDSYIQKIDEVKDCATVAVKDEITEYKMHCFLTLNNDIKISEIKDKLKSKLLSFQIPHKFIVMENLPQNSSGKIDKKALKLLIK